MHNSWRTCTIPDFFSIKVYTYIYYVFERDQKNATKFFWILILILIEIWIGLKCTSQSGLRLFYKLCSKKFGCKIWVPILIQWNKNWPFFENVNQFINFRKSSGFKMSTQILLAISVSNWKHIFFHQNLTWQPHNGGCNSETDRVLFSY